MKHSLNLRKLARALMCALALGASFSMVAVDFAEAKRDRGGGSAKRFSGGGGSGGHKAQRRSGGSGDRVKARQTKQGGDFGGGLKRDRTASQG